MPMCTETVEGIAESEHYAQGNPHRGVRHSPAFTCVSRTGNPTNSKNGCHPTRAMDRHPTRSMNRRDSPQHRHRGGHLHRPSTTNVPRTFPSNHNAEATPATNNNSDSKPLAVGCTVEPLAGNSPAFPLPFPSPPPSR